MDREDLLDRLASKELGKDELLSVVEGDNSLLPTLINGISSKKATVRYGCAKVAMEMSERHPDAMYPFIKFFLGLLNGKYRILTWNAIVIVANLASVDKENAIDGAFDEYFGLMGDEYMVTVANVVGNAHKIARAKPYLATKIAKTLLSAEVIPLTPHLTEECRRVIMQSAIMSLNGFLDLVVDKEDVIAFVRRQLGSSRPGLDNAARKFIDRWDGGGGLGR